MAFCKKQFLNLILFFHGPSSFLCSRFGVCVNDIHFYFICNWYLVNGYIFSFRPLKVCRSASFSFSNKNLIKKLLDPTRNKEIRLQKRKCITAGLCHMNIRYMVTKSLKILNFILTFILAEDEAVLLIFFGDYMRVFYQ